MKGGSRKGYKQKTGQVFQGYEAYKSPFNKANFKPPYPNKFQSNSSNSNEQPWKKRADFINHKKWARGGKTNDQGARGNYKGKAENFDSKYNKCFQTNHVIGKQQLQPAIMPPPYMYQANAALPPLAPRVHFNPDPSLSNYYA